MLNIGLNLLEYRLLFRFLNLNLEKKPYDNVTLFKIVIWSKSILGIPITLVRIREPFILKEFFRKKK